MQKESTQNVYSCTSEDGPDGVKLVSLRLSRPGAIVFRPHLLGPTNSRNKYP